MTDALSVLDGQSLSSEQPVQLIRQAVSRQRRASSCRAPRVGVVSNRVIDESCDARIEVPLDGFKAEVSAFVSPLFDVLPGKLFGKAGPRVLAH